jgi:deazaflavin-dependent oxidoreductase (nitroreductase family)
MTVIRDPERKMSELDDFNQAVINEFRANQGRVGGQMEGMPVMLLTMTGAKTGRSLVRPLAYTRDRDRIVIVASFDGAPHNPPWYHNLIANPIATVEIGAETFKVRATPATGAERERLFNHRAAKMPFFNDIRQKTTRQFPVLVLERI